MQFRLETLAFLALLALTLVRLPSAVREPSSRLTWFATITGLGAIFMVGVVVPLPVLDGWMGGSNVVNLIQNLLATNASVSSRNCISRTPPRHDDLGG